MPCRHRRGCRLGGRGSIGEQRCLLARAPGTPQHAASSAAAAQLPLLQPAVLCRLLAALPSLRQGNCCVELLNVHPPSKTHSSFS